VLPVEPNARKQAQAAQQQLGMEGGGNSDHLALVKVSQPPPPPLFSCRSFKIEASKQAYPRICTQMKDINIAPTVTSNQPMLPHCSGRCVKYLVFVRVVRTRQVPPPPRVCVYVCVWGGVSSQTLLPSGNF